MFFVDQMFECIYYNDEFMFDTDRWEGSANLVKVEDDKLTFTINGKCNLSFRTGDNEVWDEGAFYQSGELTATIVGDMNPEGR